MESEAAEAVTTRLLEESGGEVMMAGLGARDTLRLEAGMCLYGNDLDEQTTPNEARLLWTVGAHKKKAKSPDAFLGCARVWEEMETKSLVQRVRVGLLLDKGGPPARRTR